MTENEQVDNIHISCMKTACDLATLSVKRGSGPFGAVILQKNTNEIVGKGHNRVVIENDPTLHAEIVAIRSACHYLDKFQLDDCVLYTSCEPCPMCLSAAYWARIPTIYYGNTKADAKNIGFDDSFIYDEIAKPLEKRAIEMVNLTEIKGYALGAFLEWDAKKDKTPY
jgi:tRNA(Arg) A34 adenosine deaminase TadA